MLLRLLLNAIQYRLSLREQKALSGSLFGRAGDWLGMGAQCTKTRTRWEGRHAPGCADHPWVKCWGYDWPPKCFSTQGLSVLPPLWAHTGPCKLSGLSSWKPRKRQHSTERYLQIKPVLALPPTQAGPLFHFNMPNSMESARQ